MAHVSQIICDACGNVEDTGGGRIPSIRSICFSVGPRQTPTDDINTALDLCEYCRMKIVGAIKRALKKED